MKSSWSRRDRSIQMVLLLTLAGCRETPLLVGGEKAQEDNCQSCVEGEVCLSGECVEICKSDFDCGAYGYCQAGYCKQDGEFYVKSIVPLNGSQNVDPAISEIVVNFSEDIEASSVTLQTVKLKNPSGAVCIENAVLDRVITITPCDRLEGNTTYQIELKKEIMSKQKHSLVSDKTSSFKTALQNEQPNQDDPNGLARKGNYHRYGIKSLAGRMSGGGISIDVVGGEIGGRAENINQTVKIGSMAE